MGRLLLVAVLFLGVIYPEYAPANDPLEKRVCQILGLGDLTFESAQTQVPVTDVPDEVKNSKIAFLNGSSSIKITPKKKASLTEGTLIFWIYLPADNKIKRKNEIHNAFIVALGELPQKIGKQPLLPARFGAAVFTSSEEPTDLYPRTVTCTSLMATPIYSDIELSGWHQFALVFIGKHLALYVDGVLVQIAEPAADGPAINLLPVRLDSLLISNGLPNGKCADLGKVGIHGMVIANRRFSLDEIRNYRLNAELPKDVTAVADINFGAGRSSLKSADVKIIGDISFSSVDDHQ